MPDRNEKTREARPRQRGARLYEEELGGRQEILWRLGVGAILGAILLLVVLSSTGLRPPGETPSEATAPNEGGQAAFITELVQPGI